MEGGIAVDHFKFGEVDVEMNISINSDGQVIETLVDHGTSRETIFRSVNFFRWYVGCLQDSLSRIAVPKVFLDGDYEDGTATPN